MSPVLREERLSGQSDASLQEIVYTPTPSSPADKKGYQPLQGIRVSKEEEERLSRLSESTRIREKFPGRIPIVVNPHKKTDPPIDKKKYLAPSDITVSQFQYVIRKRLLLSPDTAFFLFLEDRSIPTPASTMREVYDWNRSGDGFLYLTYTLENAFGLGGST